MLVGLVVAALLVLLQLAMLQQAWSLDAAGLFAKGNGAYGQGDLGSAADLYRKAILLDDAQADYHCNLASVLSDLGQPAEAAAEYRVALSLDDRHASALFNLAMLLQENPDSLSESASLYVRLLSVEPSNFSALSNLGAVYHQLGDLGKSVQLYERAALAFESSEFAAAGDKAPLGSVLEHLGRALLRMHDVALASAGSTAADAVGTLRERGIEALRAAIAVDPGNEIAAHMLSAAAAAATEVGGSSPQIAAASEVAPEGYVRRVFDDYAATFEESLAKLGYRAPAIIAELMQGKRLGRAAQFGVVVDLGCGTGLLPPALSLGPAAEREDVELGKAPVVLGVDLSLGMLAQAEAKGVYHQLFAGEVVYFLNKFAAHRERGCVPLPTRPEDARRKLGGSIVRQLRADSEAEDFDVNFRVDADVCARGGPMLFAAADVLVYFGALEVYVSALARCMRPGDLAVFTVEAAAPDEEGWVLLPSGRYAHSRAYIQRLCADKFDIAALEPIAARQELGKDVKGFVVALRARSSK